MSFDQVPDDRQTDTQAGEARTASLGTILIIEDDPRMQKVLRRMFVEENYTVLIAGDGQVAVVQDDSADAYALPGPRGRIVITTGMLAALSEAECGVLLAHERAHAAGRHYLFTALARLSAAANPLLRPMAAAISYSVERWADERAAVVSGSRLLAARTIAKAALAAAGAPPARMSTAGVLAAVPSRAELRKAGSVPRRVDALLCPPPPRRIMLLLLAIALVAAAGLAAFHAAGDLHAMVEFAQAAAVS